MALISARESKLPGGSEFQKISTIAGFEPTQECPSGFRGRRLNHSARLPYHLRRGKETNL